MENKLGQGDNFKATVEDQVRHDDIGLGHSNKGNGKERINMYLKDTVNYWWLTGLLIKGFWRK